MRLQAALCLLLGILHHGGAQRLGADTSQRDPCKEKDGLAPHPDYCDRYFECTGGQSYEVDCPNGLVYTGNGALLDNCDYPNEKPRACRDKQLANPPITTEHCDWLYGTFGHETSCTRYWTCWNGTSTEQFCIGGLLYNEETHACDWPQFVVGCQKHPLCVEDPNGNVPLGRSCERYWSCQGGYPRLMRCPATLVFDRRTRRCLSPPTDDCEAPPTEAPPLLPLETRQRRRGSTDRSSQPLTPARRGPTDRSSQPLTPARRGPTDRSSQPLTPARRRPAISNEVTLAEPEGQGQGQGPDAAGSQLQGRPVGTLPIN